MQRSNLIKFAFFATAFAVFAALLIYYFKLDKQQRVKIYLTQQIDKLYSEFRATKNTYQKLSTFVYDELAHDPVFIKALRENKKEELLRILRRHFAILRKYSINYLTLYDGSGNVLVSMNRPKKRSSKKELFAKSSSNELIIRFKRPIYYQKQMLALFEAAVSYNIIKQELQRLFRSYYEYIVSEKVIDKNLLSYGNYLFVQSDIDPRFYYEEIAQRSESGTQRMLIHAINSAIKGHIAAQLSRGKSFATYAKIDGNYYVVTFLAIKANDALGYLISYHTDTNLASFDTIFWQNVILSLLVLIVLLAFFYYFLQTKSRFEQMAVTDKLTGLYNRHKFYQVATQELTRAKRHKRPLSLIIFDIDRFKDINDRYGHDVGDAVLRTIAKLVRSNIRRYDTAFRWGGEEFIVLAPETKPKDAMKLAEKLRNIIASHPFERVGQVTVSLGVAGFDEGGEEDIDALIKRADNALYLSKKDGRNRSTLAL